MILDKKKVLFDEDTTIAIKRIKRTGNKLLYLLIFYRLYLIDKSKPILLVKNLGVLIEFTFK